MSASAASSDGGSVWWIILLIFLFGGAVLEFAAEFFSDLGKALRGMNENRHKRKMELRRLEIEAAQTKPGGPVAAPAPGLCRHRQAVPVRDINGHTVAWLCTACDTKLPKEFSIYEEDL